MLHHRRLQHGLPLCIMLLQVVECSFVVLTNNVENKFLFIELNSGYMNRDGENLAVHMKIECLRYPTCPTRIGAVIHTL
uniref:Putative secreted protein n=1 Tax=Amblyomma triste TaxID=251400 RepID=A0A023G0U6_AMBTT